MPRGSPNGRHFGEVVRAVDPATLDAQQRSDLD